MSYEDFDRRWRARAGSALLDHTAAQVAAHGLEWDRDAFMGAVSANLAEGRFTLVVAVDEITPELQRIIEYLSIHTQPGVDVVALELGFVADGDLQILIPRAYGMEMAERKATAAGGRRAWDEASFFEALEALTPLQNAGASSPSSARIAPRRGRMIPGEMSKSGTATRGRGARRRRS